jgi:hypothetical protein
MDMKLTTHLSLVPICVFKGFMISPVMFGTVYNGVLRIIFARKILFVCLLFHDTTYRDSMASMIG